MIRKTSLLDGAGDEDHLQSMCRREGTFVYYDLETKTNYMDIFEMTCVVVEFAMQ